jgi:hypothetical protein
MTQLTYYFSTPSDLLGKLRRDYVRLSAAVQSRSHEKIADCVFDFSNTGYSLIDWLKKNSSNKLLPIDVENHLKSHPVLQACRDMCNANKHYEITKYTPIATTVYASATASSSISNSWLIEGSGIILEFDPDQPFRVKILLSNGNKFEILDFGREVLQAWDVFFSIYEIK